MRSLLLASPFMQGPDVKTAQGKLIRAKFLRAGLNDGVYGPETSRAAQLAHWELGFPAALANASSFGDTLDAVLTAFLKDGDKGLAADYLKRRTARLKAQTLGDKALAYLKTHIGETEQPSGSNRMPWASEWYMGVSTTWSAKNWTTAKPGPPWCACAVTRSYTEAGSKAFVKGSRYAYVPYIVHDAIAGINGLIRTFEPRPGDPVCFDWTGDGTFDHVGLVDEPPRSMANGTGFSTVEGNTSFDAGGDQSNGGAVAAKDDRSILSGGRVIFVHVSK